MNAAIKDLILFHNSVRTASQQITIVHSWHCEHHQYCHSNLS